VAIIADIRDLDPAELLLVVSMTRKTGRLSATSDDQKILLAFRKGSIVHATSPAVRERLGSILVDRGVISEDNLLRALERQGQQLEPKLLGTVLVEMGLASPAAIQQAVLFQYEAVIRQLLAWDRGDMTFQVADVADLGAVPVDPAEVLVCIGQQGRSPMVKTLVRAALARTQGPPGTARAGQSGRAALATG